MKSYSSKEVIAILKANGWYEVRCKGDHHQFKHSLKKGTVTVPHPKKNLPAGLINSISKQTGIRFE